MFAPNLEASGLKLVGGRLLPGPNGPASFLMYEGASGERYTIYTAKTETGATQMRYAKATRTAHCSGPSAASATSSAAAATAIA